MQCYVRLHSVLMVFLDLSYNDASLLSKHVFPGLTSFVLRL